MEKFVLASKSPRRREILSKLGYEFDVIPSTLEEKKDLTKSVYEIAKTLAEVKAKDVFSKTQRLTVGADTIVVLDGEILGKPANKSINKDFLQRLSGKYHEVITGWAVVSKDEFLSGYEVSKVLFNKLTQDEIESYVESGLGLDKAGGYGIQDKFNLVKEVEGSIDNVIGLPSKIIDGVLKKLL